jgi:hypothetical protein
MSELREELNQAAIKEFALRCSKAYRAGKFTRVGEDFIQECLDDVECLLREIRNKYNTLHPALGQGSSLALPGEEDNVFIVKGAFKDRLETIFNQAICRMIQNKVQRQPTVGVTLGRTR